MRALLAVTLALGVCAAARAQPIATAPQAEPEARYQALLASAKASAPNADWQALRIAYASRPGFRIFSQSDARRQMLEAAGKSDCAVALPAAKAAIEEAYVDIDAHMIAAFCEENAGQADAARLDRDVGAGLVASIETGDGLTPATAFTPIDVDEEYAVMRALGRKVTDQSLIHEGGHAYDALRTVNAKGEVATYYFLIDRVLAAEAAALKPGSVSEGGPPSRTP
ncbi:MAG TPA: DUF4919 domain-containing protein [Caulobacteraceae bacterium]|jgi:hypothetical protein